MEALVISWLQAIGAEGVVPAECKLVVKQYVPEIMKAIVTLPADEVNPGRVFKPTPLFRSCGRAQ